LAMIGAHLKSASAQTLLSGMWIIRET
jgi:hypothetical protein